MNQVVPVDATPTEFVRWIFGRLNAHDVDGLRAAWTDETVVSFPDATCHGADELAAYFSEKFAGIEGFHIEAVAISERDDDVLVHWSLSGRHTGTLLGVAATGKTLELQGFDHFVLRGHTVLTNTVVFDQLAFARQVGLMPPDGSVVDSALKSAFNARTRAVRALRRSSSTS